MYSSKVRLVARADVGKHFRARAASSFVTREACPDTAHPRPRAVVLVLGFGGAQPRHVAKYAQLYRGKGCATVSGTASNYDVFIDHTGLAVFGKEGVRHVADLLRENDVKHPTSHPRDRTPIIMHLLSNGGAFTARSIGEILDARDGAGDDVQDLELFAARLRLGCQVFDSAPCHLGVKSTFAVIKHLLPNPLVGIPAATLFALLSGARHAIPTMLGQRSPRDMFWQALLEDHHCRRQAFIYTRRDDVADAEKIEEFMREREKRGVHVVAKHFAESQHVQHLRLHAPEYSDFIGSVLASMERSNGSAGEARNTE